MYSVDRPLKGGIGAALRSTQLRRLPMFPLPNIVLFPNALLPLHIFEERYRKMTRDVLAGNRLMAVSLLLGPEVPGGPPPPVAEIAGVGEVILAHELPDGRFNLVLRGRARIRIEREIATREPYRVIVATEIVDQPAEYPADLEEAHTSLRALAGGLADAIPEGGELLRHVVAAQDTASALADVLASALIVDTDARQRLLETTDVGTRVERVVVEVAAMTSRLRPRAN